MRVLILNQDKFYASLLGNATKKLGHTAVVVTNLELAMKTIAGGLVDALLIDLESQGSPGVDFAFELHRKGLHVLVGFCTGTCQMEELVAMAKNLGPILPKVWTHSDLRIILSEFQHQLNSQVDLKIATKTRAESEPPEKEPLYARGTGQTSAFEPNEPTQPLIAQGTGAGAVAIDPEQVNTDSRTTMTMSKQVIEEQIALAENHNPNRNSDSGGNRGKKSQSLPSDKELPRVHIACKSWNQVERLCQDVKRGTRTITVRARSEIKIGQNVNLALELPDKLTVPILASVLRVQRSKNDGVFSYHLNLIGLGENEVKQLLVRAHTGLAVHGLNATPPPIRARNRIVPTQDSIPSSRDAGTPAPYQDDVKISWGKPQDN